ncbi:hypothetical protein [Rhodanobacter sp. DHG33]|uniref:hypothetical protein n=1 Tax=Rhodanobacter sp. DHG33 TaxID=2775921 RepID=UPI001784DA2F|nr:hypothetical protein [Rhodanobacter sp. DHG33]MBD8900010.1 hypothetical protein [Rhodanobacter sp. DHG33]
MSQMEVPDDSGAVRVEADTSAKRALSGVELRLTSEELRQPGVQKLLIDRLYGAEQEIESLKRLRSDFHSTRELLIEAQSAQKRYTSLDALQSTLLGVGCLVLGFLPTVWGRWQEFALVLVAGLGLLGASVQSKRSNK